MMVLVVLQDELNIKSPALVYIIDGMRDIHSDESVRSVGGRSVRHTSVRLTSSTLPLKRDATKHAA